MKRGDIVVIADRTAGDFAGKPRPALIVQSDTFNDTHDSFTVCLITSALTHHGLFRVPLPADNETGLLAPSEVAADKVQSIRRQKIARRIGNADEDKMIEVDQALRRWLAL